MSDHVGHERVTGHILGSTSSRHARVPQLDILIVDASAPIPKAADLCLQVFKLWAIPDHQESSYTEQAHGYYDPRESIAALLGLRVVVLLALHSQQRVNVPSAAREWLLCDNYVLNSFAVVSSGLPMFPGSSWSGPCRIKAPSRSSQVCCRHVRIGAGAAGQYVSRCK